MGVLSGQVAIVTGAGRGIGRAIAESLAIAGADVVVTARTQADLDGVVSAITAAGGRSCAIAADAREPSAIAAVVTAAEQQFGPVNLLVNNAGTMGAIGPLWETEPAEWASVLAVNLEAPYRWAHAVLPGMVAAHRGRIINLISSAAIIGGGYNSAYSVSKTALLRLSEVLANETREHGIAVFALDPGAVWTDMTRTMVASPALQRWAPGFDDLLAQNAQPAAVPAVACVTLASGAADALSGLYLRAGREFLQLVPQAEKLRQEERYVLRIRTIRG